MTSIEIIESNNDFIVVNKPANLSFHCETSTKGLAAQLNQQTGLTLWPVHRLDKITSGLVVFAKTSANAAKFGELFENCQMNKTYLALSDKKPKKKMGLIAGDMNKSRRGNWKLVQSKHNPALTRFKSCALKPGIRLFLVKPETGKTHQIRVALKSVGAPILGDSRYGGSPSDRGYLHAYRLGFEWDGKSLRFECLPNNEHHFQTASLVNAINTLESN